MMGPSDVAACYTIHTVCCNLDVGRRVLVGFLKTCTAR